MIARLIKYRQATAWSLFVVFYLSIVAPVFGRASDDISYVSSYDLSRGSRTIHGGKGSSINGIDKLGPIDKTANITKAAITKHNHHPDIGGPSQPEMSSFKSVSTDNMVDLFTGAFSYNVPLLDVGGYPVNLFYGGNVGMEQEASWVGFGWNINPGDVNRNMRGIPDDFDGTDTLVEQQQMKPKEIWDVNLAADVELAGIEGLNIGSPTLGMTFDNYLGPALNLGINFGASFALAQEVGGSDKTLALSLGIGTNLSSRTGFSVSPNTSLDVQGSSTDIVSKIGVGLSTSYNSRVGVASMQFSTQPSFYGSNGGIIGTLDKYSKTINFAKPSCLPALHMPITNSNGSGSFQLGLAIFGVDGAVSASVSESKQYVAGADVTQRKPLVGYMYYQNAVNDPNAVMDFTRFNDKEVVQNTPIIAAPQYTYDVFSIQGEGTGGCIRAYRNDLGYVRDNTTRSQDNATGIGLDIGLPGQFGGYVQKTKTPTEVGEWGDGNKLRSATSFMAADTSWENVYFRNPGENCALDPAEYNRIGGTDLVRYALGGQPHSPSIDLLFQHCNMDGVFNGGVTNIPATPTSGMRKKRTQVTSFLTADEASIIGLDKIIKSYDDYTILDGYNNLKYDSIPRVGKYRKGHHISEVNVTEANGKRYVYGLPVYNTSQEDFTFSIEAPNNDVDTDKVPIDPSWMATSSPLLASNSPRDGYLDIVQTPAYAHSFLLTGLLSPDYVDLTGDGITDDDLGDAVKFNYTQIKAGHKWRTPLTSDDEANFNPGNRTEIKDDKGIVSYGERESWYLHSIESKTMIAIFRLGNRSDGKGAAGVNGGVNGSDTSMKRLDRIDLYSKSDLKQNGLAKAKPIKSVHFCYSYSLCHGSPDNVSGGGRLTLDSIYFTFNGQERLNKDKYAFSYLDSAGNGNPNYAFSGSDRWGVYKPASMNPGEMKNRDYPYSIQDPTKKNAIDQNVAAWTLKRILLPSGGQVEVGYESNDYAYVENLHATDMMQVAGFGKDTNTVTNELFGISGSGLQEHDIVFVKVPQACGSAGDVFRYYLQGNSQLAFKFSVLMPKGLEYLRSYATIRNGEYGVYGGDPSGKTIWIKLDEVDGIGALSMTAVEYLRQQLPGQAYVGYDISDESGLEQIGEMVKSFLNTMKTAFSNPINSLREQGMSLIVDTTKTFVRLNDPDGFKYGGGRRVKYIRLKDNWQAMTGQYTSTYGQTYGYTTTETLNGLTRTISSGVATYEPSIGGEENPFQTSLQVEDKLPLGPASFTSIEMPVLDAFFPAPSVGYSKVTVKSINTNPDTTKASRSGIGEQVTQYYTAKDYPVQYANTNLDPASDEEEHTSSITEFWNQSAYDYKALSQGFLIITNDMHGKMKSKTSYPQNDSTTPVNYTENFYRNTGADGMADQFDFVDNAQGGSITPGNMGVDVELMTDTREFSTTMNSTDIQGQTDMFPVIIPFWIPFIWPTYSNSDNVYRAVTATKVVSYHAVLDSVVVIDKGSQVSTKNLVYDAETGNVVVNRTNNEFNQAVYTTNYPAYWAYSGMGPAYKNIDAVYSNINFNNGQITNTGFGQGIFESGDELYLTNPGAGSPGCVGASPNVELLWAYDTSKNNTSLTDTAAHFLFMDSVGHLYTKSGVSFKIVRSGKRNILDANVASIVSMASPINGNILTDTASLFIDNSSKVINAAASEYKEKWQTDDDIISRMQTIYECGTRIEEPSCSGNHLEININPYRKGLMGNFKPCRSMVFYGGRSEPDPSVATNLSQNGFLSDFYPYWNFNPSGNLVPNTTDTDWVWNEQTTKFNSNGLELETKNALGIYTSAQYGYDKSLPVAITNNADYNEMFAEGFEDYDFKAAIDNSATNSCNRQHIYFGNIANVQIVDMDSLGLNAHTGKYALQIAHNSIAQKTISLQTDYPGHFDLKFNKDSIISLIHPGGDTLEESVRPPYGFGYPQKLAFEMNFYATGPTVGLTNGMQPFTYGEESGGGNSTYFYCYDSLGDPYQIFNYILPATGEAVTGIAANTGAYYSTSTRQYIKIDACKYYTFNLNVHSEVQNASYSDDAWFGLKIRPLNGNPYDDPLKTFDCGANEDSDDGGISCPVNGVGACIGFSYDRALTDSVYLQKGIYTIDAQSEFNHSGWEFGGNSYSTDGGGFTSGFSYSTNIPGNSYQNIDSANTCRYVTPIAADDSMLNAAFTVPTSKKMVFSGWVKETCGSRNAGVPCTVNSYTNNQVQLQFDDGGSSNVTFVPSGPIIDSWQRYEGYFTAPSDANTMTMKFINNSDSMIYFDDIRIQPFNADMKSYVYDPTTLRLIAELDANNYATFYEYDEEGMLVRTKAETVQGIKTINETRSAKQKNINNIQ